MGTDAIAVRRVRWSLTRTMSKETQDPCCVVSLSFHPVHCVPARTFVYVLGSPAEVPPHLRSRCALVKPPRLGFRCAGRLCLALATQSPEPSSGNATHNQMATVDLTHGPTGKTQSPFPTRVTESATATHVCKWQREGMRFPKLKRAV